MARSEVVWSWYAVERGGILALERRNTTEMARDTSGSMWYKLEQGGMTRVLSTIQNFDGIDSQSPEEVRREGAASQGRRDSDAAEFGRHRASVSEGTMLGGGRHDVGGKARPIHMSRHSSTSIKLSAQIIRPVFRKVRLTPSQIFELGKCWYWECVSAPPQIS